MLVQNRNMMPKGKLSYRSTLPRVRNSNSFAMRSNAILNRFQSLCVLLGMIWLIGGANVTDTEAAIPDPVVQSQLVWLSPQAHPGDQRVLAIILDIHDGFHINPDSSRLEDPFLIPTQLEVTETSSGLVAHGKRFPAPHSVVVGTLDHERQVSGYEDRVVLYVPFALDPGTHLGFKNVQIELTYQACNRTQCLPPVTMVLETSLEVVAPSVQISETGDPSLFAGFDALAGDLADQSVEFDWFGWSFAVQTSNGLGMALLLAISALGGLLLNFTPCVLPVIPLKIMGLSHAAGHRRRCLALGLSMSAGVVGFWLVLGGLIAGVRGFWATNQLFQYPLFTIAMGVVIAIMAVGMMGLFTVQLPRWVRAFDPKQDTLIGSFGLGVMTAILSTPCTAPFMGAAAAWAATQLPWTTLLTFLAIGGGMAFPYLLLSSFPALVNRVPRTGPGSELIKQVMGLLLLAAAIYFVGVGITGILVEPPDSPSLVYWWFVMIDIAAAGGWLGYRTIRMTHSLCHRTLFVGIGVILLTLALYGGVRLTDRGPIRWVAYTPERLVTALDERQAIVIDFTAEWCLNCKWLEKNVLYQPLVANRLQQHDVVAMKVDLTGRNQAGNDMLQSVGRVAIPLLVVFAPDGSEIFKSDFYTGQQVIEAIDRATSR